MKQNDLLIFVLNFCSHQTQEAVHTLSAMTAGIRRNWIQAVMKNVRPSTAPDVARCVPTHDAVKQKWFLSLKYLYFVYKLFPA